MRKGWLLGLSMLILAGSLAVGLVWVLIGDWQASPQYRTAMESLALNTATRMHGIKIVFWAGLTAIVLLGLTGLVAGLLRLLWRRSRLIQPHASGLFPIVERQAGDQVYYHDPNRQWAGAAVYRANRQGVTAQQIPPPGWEEAQLQITTQAQAAQLAAAASQGRGLTAPARQLVGRVAAQASPRSIPSLPQVVVLDEAHPEERHLLTALRRDWDEVQEGR
ncbi:MAG: hypothetical protein ACOYZ7_01920 [Chloroflexota bacterium]